MGGVGGGAVVRRVPFPRGGPGPVAVRLQCCDYRRRVGLIAPQGLEALIAASGLGEVLREVT